MSKVTVAQLIETIEQRQPVQNKSSLDEAQLQTAVTGVGALDNARANQLSFMSNPRYSKALATTNAGVILIDSDHEDAVLQASIALVVTSPYLAYASCSQLFEKDIDTHSVSADSAKGNSAQHTADPASSAGNIQPTAQIHPTAVIEADVSIADNVIVGPFCVIGAGVRIGQGTRLMSHVTIASAVTIGRGCIIYPQVVIGHDCQLGDDVRVHANATIGMEGFGFAPTADPAENGWERIAQLGRVIIGNHVRIGSQTCIDRGAIEDTTIGDHVIIDNLVQIAHNVTIGAGSAIAANTGMAGSTIVGKRCIIGGAVGITGHLEIVDDVTLTAMTLVTKSLKQAGSYSSGTVAMPTAKWRRAAVRFRQVK